MILDADKADASATIADDKPEAEDKKPEVSQAAHEAGSDDEAEVEPKKGRSEKDSKKRKASVQPKKAAAKGQSKTTGAKKAKKDEEAPRKITINLQQVRSGPWRVRLRRARF